MPRVVQPVLYLVEVLVICAGGLAAQRSLEAEFGFRTAGALVLEVFWLLALCLTYPTPKRREGHRAWLLVPYAILIGFGIRPVMRGLELGLHLNRAQALALFLVLFFIAYSADRGLARIHAVQRRLIPQ
jgi:hypothetical protein